MQHPLALQQLEQPWRQRRREGGGGQVEEEARGGAGDQRRRQGRPDERLEADEGTRLGRAHLMGDQQRSRSRQGRNEGKAAAGEGWSAAYRPRGERRLGRLHRGGKQRAITPSLARTLAGRQRLATVAQTTEA